MRRYLDAMDHAPYLAPMPSTATMTRVLGALGPRMLALAGEVADGAHPYLVPVEHTEQTREILGPNKRLCPEVAAVVTSDEEGTRGVARVHLSTYLQLVNYRSNLERLGFDDNDFAGGRSDRLVDALVALGRGSGSLSGCTNTSTTVPTTSLFRYFPPTRIGSRARSGTIWPPHLGCRRGT